MIAANCGTPAAEITELLRKIRPKSSSSGKISSCIGRNTPAESTRYISGSAHSNAMRCARITFFVVAGKNAPAFTVASLATIMHGTPSTLPIPVTTPAAGIFPHCSYILYAAQRPISKNGESLSSKCRSRSRTGKRPILR